MCRRTRFSNRNSTHACGGDGHPSCRMCIARDMENAIAYALDLFKEDH